jgi:hypothetical protein
MMSSKLTTPGVVGGLCAGLGLGTALATLFSTPPPAMAQGQTPPAAIASAAPKPLDTDKALAGDQLKLAREALEELEVLRKNARLDVLDPRVAVWERRQIEALRASRVGRAELVSASSRPGSCTWKSWTGSTRRSRARPG